MKISKTLLFSLLSCGLILSACGSSESSSSAPAPASSSAEASSVAPSSSSAPEVDKYAITATKFNEVVKGYGCFDGSATYAVKLTVSVGDQEYNLKLELQDHKQKQMRLDDEGEVTDTTYVNIYKGTTDNKYYIDRYDQNHDEDWEIETEEFKGYTYDTGEMGVAFDKLEFTDFNYDKANHKYVLKESKALNYEFDDNPVVYTYVSLALYFENNNIVKVESSFKFGDEEIVYSSVITGSKFGSTTVTLPDGYRDITYAEFVEAYAAKQDAPWNHIEGTYMTNMIEEPEPVVGDLVEGAWTLDTTKSGEHVSVNTIYGYILDQHSVDYYENPPAGTTINAFKKDNGGYKLYVERNMEGHLVITDARMDQYFYMISSLFVVDGATQQDHHATWSTK